MGKHSGGRFGAVAVVTALMGMMLAAAIAAPAQTYSVVYTFTGGPDGAEPVSGLSPDLAGNLYGTTVQGGSQSGKCGFTNGCGTVFRIDSSGNETTLYTFTGGSDGSQPQGNLLLGSDGSIYGTASAGGKFGGSCTFLFGCGVVFKIDSMGNETVLHTFTGGSDGADPRAGLVRDKVGNLYGASAAGGTDGWGVVFTLSPSGQETVLWTFTGGGDGAEPIGQLYRDSNGDLYGTTIFGGDAQAGVVYKVVGPGSETVVYSFSGTSEGGSPFGGVVLDSSGNIYGTTQLGGSHDLGVVFKIDPAGSETVLYNFAGQGDGENPTSTLIIDAQGNLYGTTAQGGFNDYGTIFKVKPAGEETVLYTFTGGSDGASPVAGLLAFRGYLYGTTPSGGSMQGPSGSGVVFKLSLH
jgi:uncharacterized repeat protein (TIGR03803 family)